MVLLIYLSSIIVSVLASFAYILGVDIQPINIFICATPFLFLQLLKIAVSFLPD